MENNSFTFNFRGFAVGAAVFFLVMLAANQLIAHLMVDADANDNIGLSISKNPLVYNNYDYLFIGDSRTHQGVDPRVFMREMKSLTGHEVTAYNLGRPAMQAPFYYLVTKDYLNVTGYKPKAIIANISFYMLGGTKWLEDIYLGYYKPKPWQVVDVVKHRLLRPHRALQWYVRSYVPMLRFRKRIKSLYWGLLTNFDGAMRGIRAIGKNNKKYYDPETFGYMSRGFSHIEDEDVPKSNHVFGAGYSIYKHYFKDFFKLARDKGYKVIIYDFPWPDIWLKNKEKQKRFGPIHAHWKKIIKEIAEGNPNVIFLDHDIYWPKENFVDPLHLNQNGAEKLTTQLARFVHQQTEPIQN